MRNTSSNTGDKSFDLGSSFPAAVKALEESVIALLSNGWEESPRYYAREVASALAASAKLSGWKEQARVLDSVRSLLALPIVEVIPIHQEVEAKLIELLAFLREDPLADTA